jgi:hypothetical protein
MSQEIEYAFLDKNDYVINVSVFASNDVGILWAIAQHLTSPKFISCFDFGKAEVGDKWDSENNEWIKNARSSSVTLDEEGDWIVPDQLHPTHPDYVPPVEEESTDPIL